MRSCLLFVLIIFLFVFVPTFFFFINIAETLSPNFMKKEIERSGVIEQISQNLPSDIADGLNSDGSINQAAIKNSLAAIPDQDIKNTLEENIDRNIAALSNPAAKELVVDLSSITSKIPSEVTEQLKQSGQAELKDRYVYKIPLTIRLYRFVNNNLALVKIAGLTIIVVIMALIALAAQSWHTKLRAISLALLVPGLFMLLPSAFLRLVSFTLPKMEDVPAVVSTIANDLFKLIKIDITNLYLLESFALIFLAISLFVASFFIAKEAVSPPPSQPQTPTQP